MIFNKIDNRNKKITIMSNQLIEQLNIDLDKVIYNLIDFNRSLGNSISTWAAIGTEIIKRDLII